MPRLKRRGGSTPETDTNKKAKLQETTSFAAPSVIGTLTINGNQKLSVVMGDDIKNTQETALAYVFNKLRKPRTKKIISRTQETGKSEKSGKLRKMFIFPEHAPQYALNPEVLTYLDKITTFILNGLEDFSHTITPKLDELTALLNRPHTRSAPIGNKDAILVRYLEKAYAIDQLIQSKIEPLLTKYNELKSNLAYYLKFDPKHEKLIILQEFITTADDLLTKHTTTVSEQVKSNIANKSIDSLQLSSDKIESWLETIQSTIVVSNATPVATFS